MATATTPDLSKLKGPATRCRMCKNADLPLPLRIHCKFCLTSGYVSLCLPCNGSGKIGAEDVWGGKSVHRSTCNTCGGVGLIPARSPEQPTAEVGTVAMPEGAADGAEVTEVVKGEKNVPKEQPKAVAAVAAVAPVANATPQPPIPVKGPVGDQKPA